MYDYCIFLNPLQKFGARFKLSVSADLSQCQAYFSFLTFVSLYRDFIYLSSKGRRVVRGNVNIH